MEKRLILLSVLLTMCTSLFAQREHIVQKGETIESVAKKYGVRVDELEAANPIVIKYFYVSSPLVIPVHVPNEEEIRAMEEEKARLIALREQEEAEKAERRARRNRFWGGLFDAVAEAFVGKPNQPMVSSAYAPTVSSSSYTPQLAPMYNVNGTYICEPYYTPSPRMVQYNTQNVSTGPNPFNQQMTFTMIGDQKAEYEKRLAFLGIQPIRFKTAAEIEEEQKIFINNYKATHPGCTDDEAYSAYIKKTDREFEESNRKAQESTRQYQEWLNAQNQQNTNNSSTTNTSTQYTTPNNVSSNSNKVYCIKSSASDNYHCNGTGKCSRCNGNRRYYDNTFGNNHLVDPCGTCNGSGICPACNGRSK